MSSLPNVPGSRLGFTARGTLAWSKESASRPMRSSRKRFTSAVGGTPHGILAKKTGNRLAKLEVMLDTLLQHPQKGCFLLGFMMFDIMWWCFMYLKTARKHPFEAHSPYVCYAQAGSLRQRFCGGIVRKGPARRPWTWNLKVYRHKKGKAVYPFTPSR